MKKYTIDVFKGIQYLELERCYSMQGFLYYYNVDQDARFLPEAVFHEYDDALDAYCTECDRVVRFHQSQIDLINKLKSQELDD